MQVLAIKESAKCNNLCSGVQCCQALCPVSIFVSVCPKNLRKWTQTDTKVTFHHHPPPPPPPTHPPENFFWSKMKGMAKIRLFYSGDMALILPR